MKRLIKRTIAGICIALAVCLSVWLYFFWSLLHGTRQMTETRTLPAEELSHCLTHLNPAIRVTAGFEASSYGGLHGDGGCVTIYLVDPDGTEELIKGLKQFHEVQKKKWPDQYQYTWGESPHPDLSGLENLVPARFQPASGNYVIGRDSSHNHTISIETRKGYVCFADSRW